MQGKQLDVVQLVPMYIQEYVCFSEPLDIPETSRSREDEEAAA